MTNNRLFFALASLIVALFGLAKSSGAWQNGRLPIDPLDNVKLLWVDGQASKYRDAKRISCSIAPERPCLDALLKVETWDKRQKEVYDYLEHKYGTRNFIFDQESGIAKPYFGSGRGQIDTHNQGRTAAAFARRLPEAKSQEANSAVLP